MQLRKYPPILPATPLQREGENSTPVQRDLPKDQPQNKHGGGKQIACNECRRRKTKCDGQRPSCFNCRRRGITDCVYVDKLVPTPEVVVEILRLLRTLPDDRATKLLRVLRRNDDPATALSIIRGNTEEHASNSGVNPDLEAPSIARDSLESELMTKNPAAYPRLLPIIPSVLAESSLLRSARNPMPDDQDGVPETTENSTAGFSQHNAEEQPSTDGDSDIGRFQFANTKQDVGYCDERLGKLDVSFWTDVDVTNDFAARVISLYIKTDHPLLGLFSPNLFIADLVEKRERYCSKFLFNALMYLGCQMYSAFDKTAIEKAEIFCRNAEDLWVYEKVQDSYLAMAGAVILSLSLIGHGKDHVVHSYANDSLTMGIRLGLFENEHPQNKNMLGKMSQDDMIARCHAAWGVFNWNVLVSMFYRQPGSECPETFPTVPIPGDEAFETVGQPPDEGYLPHDDLLGSTFPALCHFWQITRGARWIYYPDEDSPPERFELVLVEHKFRELIAWAEALSRALVLTDQSPHHVAVFHIWLHCIILDIFRRFTAHSLDQRSRMATFTAWDSSPDAAFAASVNQLKSLIVEYRTNYKASTYSILWHSGLIYLANAVLQDTSDPEWRVYFLLCIYGYESLSRPYRISEIIAQGLLSMTLRDTNMTATEARKIKETLTEQGLDNVQQSMVDEIRATFPVDLTLSLKDPVEAMAENMAKQFDSLAIFQDFLDQEQMETGD